MNEKLSESVPGMNLPVLHCPLNHTNCIQERCALWVNLTINQPSTITGVRTQVTKPLCVFVALLEANILQLNKPPAMLPVNLPNIPIRGE